MVTAKPKIQRRVGRAAFVGGLVVALVAVLGWRMPPPSGALGLELRLTVNSTGELGVMPAGEIAMENRLEPRSEHSRLVGKTRVKNQTAKTVVMRVRALPSSRDLDRRLAVVVRADERTLFRGPLRELRSPTRRALALAPGNSTQVTFVAWLPDAVRRGYQGRVLDITIELRARYGRR